MTVAEIEKLFPALCGVRWRPTSPFDLRYNCIAHAAGDSGQHWWPSQYSYWPPGVPQVETMEAFVQAYASLGFSVCATAELEPGLDKVAIYCLRGKPTHAAKQLPDGSWSSKLGDAEDIAHPFDGLNGTYYGVPTTIMCRTR